MTEESQEPPPTDPDNPDAEKPVDKKKDFADCISPTPSGEQLPPEETERIMTSMLELLQDCQKKIDEQKIDSHSLAFMLLRIKESLDAYYGCYIPTLNTYLVQAEQITADYYSYMSCSLPKYGDYVKDIEDEKSEHIDAGASAPVHKQQLLDLVRTVTDNYYAGAVFLKPGRMVFKDVNNCQGDRKDIVNKIFSPMPKWMEFQEKVTAQLDQIREQSFKISAYMDFLKQGEMKMAPTLDLTALNRPANQPDSQNKPKENIDKKDPKPDTTTVPDE